MTASSQNSIVENVETIDVKTSDTLLRGEITPDSSSPIDREDEKGRLLDELEARQDEVLEQLEMLDEKVCAILRECGVTPEGEEPDEVDPLTPQDQNIETDTEVVPVAA